MLFWISQMVCSALCHGPSPCTLRIFFKMRSLWRHQDNMTNPIVIVSKFYQYSNILLRFTSLAYPQLDIESVQDADSIQTKNPYRVVTVLEDETDVCEQLMRRYPGKLRFISRTRLITDLDQILRDEGFQQREGR